MKNIKNIAISIFIITISGLLTTQGLAQTRENGPWWPSPHGPEDQAGASNWITAEKIIAALQIPKTGETFELGHPYEASMPAFGNRPYYLMTTPPPMPASGPGVRIAVSDYFTGFIGQMGTQFDGLAHQGLNLPMADGSLETVYYNGFTAPELFQENRGRGGVEALGVENMKPFITRGILIDIAGFKGVDSLQAGYEVTMDDVHGALERQGMSVETIERGDAVLFNYGWAVNWTNPSKYNDSYVGVGENEGSPGIFADVGHWLVSRQVSLVGADTCCIEVRPRPVSESDDNPGDDNLHLILMLGSGIALLENMDLRELAAAEAWEFLFLTLPERIVGASGSPARPIAIR